MAKLCKICRLDSRVPFLTIDNQGVCDYCAGRKMTDWDLTYNVTEECIKKKKEELENIFSEIKGKYAYDCVLALSGGKDSIYLLHHLVAERGLKVLAVHVKIYFHPELPDENIASLKTKLNFGLKVVVPGKDFYIDFYSKLLRHTGRDGFCNTVCSACSKVYLGYCLKAATENKIPLVITGFSPAQFNFFELERIEIESKEGWMPDIFNTGEYGEDFLSNFWDPSKYPKGTVFPRLLSPFHVMEYNTEKIYNKLSSCNILPKRKLSIFKTNCNLIWAMMHYDVKSIGYNEELMAQAYTTRKRVLEEMKSRVTCSTDIKASVIRNVSTKIRNLIKHTLYVYWITTLIKKLEKELNLSFKEVLSKRCSLDVDLRSK